MTTTYRHRVCCIRCGKVSMVIAARFTAQLFHLCEKCVQEQSRRETLPADSYELFWGMK